MFVFYFGPHKYCGISAECFAAWCFHWFGIGFKKRFVHSFFLHVFTVYIIKSDLRFITKVRREWEGAVGLGVVVLTSSDSTLLCITDLV